MKNITNAMKEHLQQEVTTLSTCWYIKRKDNKEYFFTDNIEDLVIDGNIYLASSGFDTSNIKDSADGSVDNSEIIGIDIFLIRAIVVHQNFIVP